MCGILDELAPKSAGKYSEQIVYVEDRPGHDRRYAIDAHKIQRELGWKPVETFDTGATVFAYHVQDPKRYGVVE